MVKLAKERRIEWRNHLHVIALVEHLKESFGISNYLAVRISQMSAKESKINPSLGAIRRAVDRHAKDEEVTYHKESYNRYFYLDNLLGERVFSEALALGLIPTDSVTNKNYNNKNYNNKNNYTYKDPEEKYENPEEQKELIHSGTVSVEELGINDIRVIIPSQLLNKKISITIEKE